jgi:hypothetical protein
MARQTVADRTYEQLKSALKASSAGRIAASGGWGFCPSVGRWTSSGSLDGLGRRPVPGQQLGQTRARPALGHTIDNIGEIGLWIESVEPSRFDDRIYVRRAQATFVAAQEEKILPRHGDGPQPSFRDAVVDSEAAVAGVASGLIAHLVGTPQQDDIVRATDRLLRLGQDILAMSQGPAAAPP